MVSKFAERARRRFQKRLQRAFQAIENGATFAEAAPIAGLSKAGLHYNWTRRDIDSSRSRLSFTYTEEEAIVKMLQGYSEKGYPLRRNDLIDAVELLVRSLPEERQKRLRFRNGRPGRKFLTGFLKRHRTQISFKKPSRQEAQRFRSTNAEVLTTHFAEIEKIIKDHNIDPRRLVNLDETGISPGKDPSRVSKSKVYCTRSQAAKTVEVEFANCSRVTLMGVVFASGHAGRPVFVLKGKRINYRDIMLPNGSTMRETIVDCLPRNAYVTTRPDVVGVDKYKFLRWVKLFVNDVKDLTANNRKVLLVYDAYRSHMTIEVLELFRKNGIIAYALPAHTSGTTQPLDVGVFGPWKSYYRENVAAASASAGGSKLGMFDFCKMMTFAYDRAFSASNIIAGFRRAGLLPLNENMLIGTPRPVSSEQPDVILSPDAMVEMLAEKRRKRAEGLQLQPVVLSGGYVDTSCGLLLTSSEVMALVRKKDESNRKMSAVKNEKERKKELILLEKKESKKRKNAEHAARALQYRVRTYGDAPILPRPLKLRRIVAAKRTAEKNVGSALE